MTSDSKAKLCVCRAVINREKSEPVTGIFTWEGKSWRTGTITGLVRELPAAISDKELTRAYYSELRARREISP
jgi:hypothetical protein